MGAYLAITNTRPLQRRLIDQFRLRLTVIIAILVGCFLFSSGAGIYAFLNQQQLGMQKLAIHNDENTLLQAMIDQETGLRGYITTNATAFLDPLNSGRTQYSTVLQHLKDETAGDSFRSTASVLALTDQRASDWSNNFANVELAAMQSGNLTTARSEQTALQGKNLFDALRTSFAQLQQTTDNDLANLQAADDFIDYGALGISGLLTIFAIFWLWSTFTYFTSAQRNQLDMLKQAAADFGSGDLSVRVQDVADVDLREVGNTFNRMAAALEEQQNVLRDRDILEQVSQLNGILAASLDLSELMNNFLHTALPLLDIQVGVLYIYDPSTQNLRLFTAHGLPFNDLQPTFALGEGLVGRTAQDRQPLMISRSSQDEIQAFSVQTLLGKVLPSSLYHLPLLRGNDLLGVLVVGSVYTLREQTRNVFHVIASNVASAISNTQSYAHIQEQTRELTALTHEQEQANQALRQQRDELTALNAALEEANRARSRFLSTMSHELRTPLTSIIGFGQMLLRSSGKAPLNERQNNNIDRILKNAQHLLMLINDVLDLAKVEAGRMDVNATEVNLRSLLNEVVEETRSVAVSRSLQVSVNVTDEIQSIETDPLKLRQIILNLLSNALKFTEKGTVSISATRRTMPPTSNGQDTTEAEQVAIAVKDSGIGIGPEQQAHIFDAFYQVDASNSRNYGGTGLGLSIVREFTTLLGGKIEIESQLHQGTTFTLLLPVHTHDRQSLQEVRLNTLHRSITTEQRAAGWRMLSPATTTEHGESAEELLVIAIDDNPDVLQLITASLEQTPYRVVGIQDATQALAAVKELRPHIITLDIMMPKINGWQILHQLKSNPATASIPVILLTVLEDRSAGYVLGADEYLMKPIARDALLTTLHQLTSIHPSPERAVLTDTPQTSVDTVDVQDGDEEHRPLKPVLLVHKERDIQQLMERLVTEVGYSIQTSGEGQDIIALIEQALPDMLMLLVQMDQSLSLEEGHVFITENFPMPPAEPPV